MQCRIYQTLHNTGLPLVGPFLIVQLSLCSFQPGPCSFLTSCGYTINTFCGMSSCNAGQPSISLADVYLFLRICPTYVQDRLPVQAVAIGKECEEGWAWREQLLQVNTGACSSEDVNADWWWGSADFPGPNTPCPASFQVSLASNVQIYILTSLTCVLGVKLSFNRPALRSLLRFVCCVFT